ncbi:MAG: large-conductance mechanosensitive channel protein MscL [Oscillospiraceae bacterium]|nr:large-conductance mechanosensitive channel protein MscL [Oscillospiraceae bacterium]
MADNNLAQKSKGFIGEFKEFISKGNVMDMAVGVIIGGAFTSIVNALVDDILMPLIGALLVGVNFHNLTLTIPWGNKPVLNFGTFIQAIITFLLTAFVLFMIIKAVNKFKRDKAAAPEEPAKPSKEEELLTEIRDLLKDQK